MSSHEPAAPHRNIGIHAGALTATVTATQAGHHEPAQTAVTLRIRFGRQAADCGALRCMR